MVEPQGGDVTREGAVPVMASNASTANAEPVGEDPNEVGADDYEEEESVAESPGEALGESPENPPAAMIRNFLVSAGVSPADLTGDLSGMREFIPRMFESPRDTGAGSSDVIPHSTKNP